MNDKIKADAGAVWSASKHDEIIKRLMTDLGSNSMSVYLAFKQFANELHALATPTATGMAAPSPSEAAMREALLPFADLVPAAFPPSYDDKWEVILHGDHGEPVATLKIGDFRAAKNALSPDTGMGVPSREALVELRDFLRGEAKKTDSCYTCYTDQAAYIANRLDALLSQRQ